MFSKDFAKLTITGATHNKMLISDLCNAWLTKSHFGQYLSHF